MAKATPRAVHSLDQIREIIRKSVERLNDEEYEYVLQALKEATTSAYRVLQEDKNKCPEPDKSPTRNS